MSAAFGGGNCWLLSTGCQNSLKARRWHLRLSYSALGTLLPLAKCVSCDLMSAIRILLQFSSWDFDVWYQQVNFAPLWLQCWLLPLFQIYISKDDSRFLMVRLVGGSSSDKLIVVDNWFDELTAKARK